MVPDKSEQGEPIKDNQTGKLIYLDTRRPMPVEAELAQGDLFEVPEQEIVTFESVLAMADPVIKTVRKKKEWTCTFKASPDLWHQDRDELIHARVQEGESMSMANRARLQKGDFATIKGIVTQTQELVLGTTPTKLTYLNLTEIRPGLRASNAKVHGRTRRKTDG